MGAQGNMQNTSIKIDLGTQMFALYILHPRLATVGLLHVVYIGIGVWGGGQGGLQPPPPSFWATQVFGQRRSFFRAAAMVGGGCFSIFRRADMTSRRQCPRGGGGACECPRVGVFFNFPEGEWRHADNVQGGGCACEIPPFRKSCIRACYLCKILGNQPLRPPPPTKAFPYAYEYRPNPCNSEINLWEMHVQTIYWRY